MHKNFSFKGPLTSLISSASYFNLGIEALSGGEVVTGLNFGPPVTAWAPQLEVRSAADTALTMHNA